MRWVFTPRFGQGKAYMYCLYWPGVGHVARINQRTWSHTQGLPEQQKELVKRSLEVNHHRLRSWGNILIFYHHEKGAIVEKTSTLNICQI